MQHALSATLLVIVEGARTAIGRTMRRAPQTAWPAMTLLWGWLIRSARRFDRILATPYVPARPRPRATPAAVSATAPKASLPTWHRLRRLVASPEINGAPSQFEQFLRDPDVHALLARDPRAVRLLRGLCRRFSIPRQPDLPAVLFPTRRRTPKPRGSGAASRLRDPRPIVERTAVCPDTGRRTFVPWTAELAGYRREMAPLHRRARREAAARRKALAHG